MSLRYPYFSVPTGRPITPLDGRMERPRPIISVSLTGPKGTVPQDALLDSGADDTVFPESVAASIGIDLTNAPVGTGGGVGKGLLVLRYAKVSLRLADN